MKRTLKAFFVAFFAVFFPWLVLLVNQNVIGALLALIMQVTIVGWPFATIWAWRVQYPPKDTTKPAK